jgi:hypothetical protein
VFVDATTAPSLNSSGNGGHESFVSAISGSLNLKSVRHPVNRGSTLANVVNGSCVIIGNFLPPASESSLSDEGRIFRLKNLLYSFIPSSSWAESDSSLSLRRIGSLFLLKLDADLLEG